MHQILFLSTSSSRFHHVFDAKEIVIFLFDFLQLVFVKRTFQLGTIVFFDAVHGRNTAQSLSDGEHFFRPVWHVPFLERFLDFHQPYLIADFESKPHVAPFANVFSVKCSPYVLGIEISDQDGGACGCCDETSCCNSSPDRPTRLGIVGNWHDQNTATSALSGFG